MRKAAAIAAVTALLLKGATAADIGISAPGTSQTDDAGQAARHGGHHGGGGRGGDGGGDGGGGVIIGFPYPSGPDAPYPPSPYPFPGSIPPGSPGGPSAARDSGANQPRPWPVWYYCDQPSGYYPYVKVCSHDWQRLPVMPPPPGSGPPIANSLWEHCDDPEGYFPYIAQCRRPWVPAAASSPVPADDPEGIPVIAQWFYCEDSKGYLPYAGSCPHVWRSIPAIPPPNVPSEAKSKTAADPR